MRTFCTVISISLMAACSDHALVCPPGTELDSGTQFVLGKRFFRIDEPTDYWNAQRLCAASRGTLGYPTSEAEWASYTAACRYDGTAPDCWSGYTNAEESWARYNDAGDDDPTYPVCETWIPEGF